MIRKNLARKHTFYAGSDIRMFKKEIAILFRCHYFNKTILSNFKKLQDQAREDADVFLMFDSSNEQFEFDGDALHFIFSEKDILESGYNNYSNLSEFELKRPLVWYHADFPILLFQRRFPEYRYIWAFDYDVFFTGNWSELFKYFNSESADLVASRIQGYSENPQWENWGKPISIGVEIEQCIKAFFPVLRFSRRACELLNFAYRKGSYGYCEICVPTLIKNAGYDIKDLITDTHFADADSLRHLPVYEEAGPKPNTLYHPVRDT